MTHSIWKRKTTLSSLLIAVAVLAVGGPADAKRKDDTLVMKYGDHFTGEIKKLDSGILYFKSSYMVESVQLDWAQVDRLGSKDWFLVVSKRQTLYEPDCKNERERRSGSHYSARNGGRRAKSCANGSDIDSTKRREFLELAQRLD